MRVNPFPRGAGRPAQYIVGRAAQLNALERLTYEVQKRRRADSLCFLGPVGLGKTCLLKHARSELQKRNWLCGYSEAGPDPATAFADLLTDAREALPADGIGARFRSQLQDLSISAGPIGIGLKLDSPGEGTDYSRLSTILRSLGQLAVKNGVGVALILDEAQALPRRDLLMFYRVINRLDELPLAVILAGLPGTPSRVVSSSRREDSGEFFRENSGEWGIVYDGLGPLSWQNATKSLTLPLADNGSSLTPEGLHLLLGFAKGHPLTLQMLGSAAWLEAEGSVTESRPLAITHDHARAAIRKVTAQLTVSTYRPLWSQLSDGKKAMLRRLARCELGEMDEYWRSGRPAEYMDIFADRSLDREQYGRRRSDLVEPNGKGESVLSALEDLGIIYDNRDWARLGFVIPGFREYILER
jgi:hypothetical protein